MPDISSRFRERRCTPGADYLPMPHVAERSVSFARPDAVTESVEGFEPRARSATGLLKFVFVVAAVLFLILLCLDLRRNHGNTFSVFYFAAKTMSAGGDIYRSHADGSDRCEYVYPPLFAALVIPLTHFKVITATRIWTFVDAALTVLALTLGSMEACRRFQIRATKGTVAAIAAGAMLLGIGEIKTELATSQTDTLVLICFVLALVWLDEWPVLCGLALGFSCNIKYQTLIALPYLLLTRRWKAAASTAISSAGFALLPGLVVGFGRNVQYLGSAVGGLGHFASIDTQGAASTVSLTWIRSVSITSAIGRLLDSYGIRSSHAFLWAPLVALVCLALACQLYRNYGITMAPTGAAIKRGLNRLEGLVALEWIGLMVVWLVFGPEVSRRHMYVLLLMDVIAVTLLFACRGRQRYVLIAGLVVCQAGLRMPSDFGAWTNAFNWAGGASWSLLVFYAALLSAGFAWVRNPAGEPMLKPALAVGRGGGRGVLRVRGIEIPPGLAASLE
jgi:uncharacterized membrane protein YtjA (UPF0391 family)